MHNIRFQLRVNKWRKNVQKRIRFRNYYLIRNNSIDIIIRKTIFFPKTVKIICFDVSSLANAEILMAEENDFWARAQRNWWLSCYIFVAALLKTNYFLFTFSAQCSPLDAHNGDATFIKVTDKPEVIHLPQVILGSNRRKPINVAFKKFRIEYRRWAEVSIALAVYSYFV